MILELDDAQAKMLMELLAQAAKPVMTPSGSGEVIKGVRGTISASGPAICPEMCFRFQEAGQCVHLEKVPGMAVAYTTKFKQLREEKKAARVREHKENETSGTTWQCVLRDDWRAMPLKYGVYVWLDEYDKLVYSAKAVDLKRRHYTWAMVKANENSEKWQATVKIWWLHTGWYEEILGELTRVPFDARITEELLKDIYKTAKPLVLPEPPLG